ncbi:MAG: hypothetical protein P8182_19880 [Deltaproteobacteria bacterium]
MDYQIQQKELSEKVEALYRLADEIFNASEDFPAINRNAKRVLGAAQAMRMNLENPED